MTTFYKNYISLCAQAKKSLSAVAEEIGLSRTSPNGWKKGKIPSAVNLEKLSLYFGVSVEYLLADNEKKPPIQTDGELVERFASLSSEEKQEALRFVNFLISQRGK